MSKRTVFTTVTPLPAGIARETVLETLHSHTEMIDLNPLVEERHPIIPPPNASPEEFHCQWYSLTDRVQYLPGGMMSGKVSYNACFHDLALGVQTHCFAPLGLNIKGKWTLGGSLPGEPIAPVELGVGAPLTGLWLREDVDMKCNFMMTSFVKKTLKNAHASLVDRLMMKAQIIDASMRNQQLEDQRNDSSYSIQLPQSNTNANTSTDYSPASMYSNDSFKDGQRNSWGFSNYGLKPAPSQSSRSESTSTSQPETRHEAQRNDELYPRPLSIHSSSHGSQKESLNGRGSYQDSQNQGNGNGNASGHSSKVSWQSLNPSRSGSAHVSQPDSSMRNPNPANIAPQPPHYNPAEYVAYHYPPSAQEIRGRQTQPQPKQGYGYPPPPPPKNPVFELA